MQLQNTKPNERHKTKEKNTAKQLTHKENKRKETTRIDVKINKLMIIK